MKPLLRPIIPRPLTYIHRATNHNRQPQARAFLANPFASTTPQTITATRKFPHSASSIYAIISDVESYSQYFPFCASSVVTRTSNPATNGKRYPEEARLVVGFPKANVSEEFWSRIYCVPERIVEAVSGATETELDGSEIGHHNPRPSGGQDPTREDGLLSHLRTRWTLRDGGEGGRGRGGHGKESTEVDLRIEVAFANPVYAALSQAAVPQVAEKMIQAFERRVVDVLGKG